MKRPAKSTVKTGASITQHSESGGGSGALKGRSSNLWQVTHLWIIILVKLLPLGIQYLDLTSQQGFPLLHYEKKTLMCLLDNETDQGMISQEQNWILHCIQNVCVSQPSTTTPHSSLFLKRLNRLVWILRSDNSFCALFIQRSSASATSSTGLAEGSFFSLVKFLSFWMALSTFAVAPINLERVLNLVGSMRDSMLESGVVDTRLCNWVVFSSKVHSAGIHRWTSLCTKLAFCHSGPCLQSWLTDNSSEVNP